MPRLQCGDSHLDKVVIEGLPDAYIMSNPVLERILFNRNLIGLDFSDACQEASEAFVEHFSAEISSFGDDVAELVILTKGIYYWLHNAFAARLRRNLEANFIVTKRSTVSGTSVSIDVPYCDFSAPVHNLILADTIASGATMVAALRHYSGFHALRRVLVFSMAGTATGGRALAAFCQEREVELTIVYGLAAFGLGSNGFDLSFLHPDTICPNQDYVRRARDMYEGKPVSAVGWDFGSQAQAVRKYRMLCWIEAEYWGLQHSDLFRLKERVTDRRLVEKEMSAYADRVQLGDGAAPETQ
jgi:hypothetical protein